LLAMLSQLIVGECERLNKRTMGVRASELMSGRAKRPTKSEAIKKEQSDEKRAIFAPRFRSLSERHRCVIACASRAFTRSLTSARTTHNYSFAVWLHYCNKYLEFFDTIFMVLRGRLDQVSFLHIYHHTTIVWAWYWGVRLYIRGDSYFGALLNSIIHVFMYSYYAMVRNGRERRVCSTRSEATKNKIFRRGLKRRGAKQRLMSDYLRINNRRFAPRGSLSDNS